MASWLPGSNSMMEGMAGEAAYGMASRKHSEQGEAPDKGTRPGHTK